MEKITIVGAGGWGTALALILNNNGHKVTLTDKFSEHLNEIKVTKKNEKYLSGIDIPTEMILFENSIQSAIEKNDICIIAVPTQFIRAVLTEIPVKILKSKKIINVAKGIEITTRKRISQIITEIAGEELISNYCVLTGPSHAEEAARKKLTTVLAASDNIELAKLTQRIFANKFFRVYTNSDVIGAEIGGALKNIIAIAAGICKGLQLGDNAVAALITRGLAEITRFGIFFGADERTFSGLSGLGDLIVTCGSIHSRNFRCGLALAKENNIEKIKKDIGQAIEGIYTSEAVNAIAIEKNIDMPITEQVYNIISNSNIKPIDAVNILMSRISKTEFYL